MISVLLVAGGKSKKLAEFLEERGTFVVPFYYNDLNSHVTEIQNQIIKVDKLLYLYQIDTETGEASSNIKADMQTLRMLLSSNGFFSVGEILFIVKSGEEYQQAIKYFNVVMQECHIKNYSIKPISSLMSFAAIYDAVMGVSSIKDFQNSYRKLYRVSRGDEASLAYAPVDDKDLTIEPFRYDAVKDYEQQKLLAKKVESGIEVYETADSKVEQYYNPDFGHLRNIDVRRSKCVLISGNSKSGKTIWAGALAKSAVDQGKQVLVLDFTKCGDIYTVLTENGVAAQNAKMLDLAGNVINKSDLIVCAPKNAIEYDVRFEFLRNILNYQQSTLDVIVVICEVEDYKRLTQVFPNSFDAVCFNTTGIRQEVLEAIEALHSISVENRTIILNNICEFSMGNVVLDAPNVKELAGEEIRVVKDVLFNNFEVGKQLFTAVVG